jgi:hypothetical protein
MNMLKLVHDQQWFADGCVAAVSTGHQGSDNQLPDVEAFAAHHGNVALRDEPGAVFGLFTVRY